MALTVGSTELENAYHLHDVYKVTGSNQLLSDIGLKIVCLSSIVKTHICY